MASDTTDAAARIGLNEAMREEFRSAQRRRLLRHGVVIWRDADLPSQRPEWAESPPPAKVE